jgi:DUF1009 family protein
MGLIVGGGDLPLEIALALADSNPFIIRVKGFAQERYEAFEQATFSVGQIGGMIKALRAAECDAICFAGYVTRPKLKDLQMDPRGMIMVPKALAAGKKGDDALLRVVVDEFESAGFAVFGANELLDQLVPQLGVIGAQHPRSDHQLDIDKAVQTARSIGEMDIGQAAVSVDGIILAVEAQEGTNAMLERVAGLPQALRGATGTRCGVLAKIPKPIQERRIDLPTIGSQTVELCVKAGLAGIVLEAGGALIVDRTRVIEMLDEAGLFLIAQAAAER